MYYYCVMYSTFIFLYLQTNKYQIRHVTSVSGILFWKKYFNTFNNDNICKCNFNF